MPISMNEPLNMLQKACEELEYCELLDKAATLSDSMERLMHVAIFAISSYASSQYRTGRKVQFWRYSNVNKLIYLTILTLIAYLAFQSYDD